MLDFLLPVWNTFLVHPLINLLILADYFVKDFGLAVVMDRCLKVEHARLLGRMHWMGFDTGVIAGARR